MDSLQSEPYFEYNSDWQGWMY